MIKKNIVFMVGFLSLFISNALADNIEDIRVLEAKIEILQQVNSDILSTIYRCLWWIWTILLFILGYNFWQNFELNNKKLSTIKTELEEQSKNNFLGIKAKNTQEMNNIKKELKWEYKQLERDIKIIKAFEYKRNDQLWFIVNFIEILENDIDDNIDYHIQESLEEIKKWLVDCHITKDLIPDLQKQLNKLASEYELQKDEIETLITQRYKNL